MLHFCRHSPVSQLLEIHFCAAITQYLYQHPNSGVEDYLCNKLNELPEPAIEQYLLQFVYLAASRPGSALERTIIGLCAKSFVIAIKVLLAVWPCWPFTTS